MEETEGEGVPSRLLWVGNVAADASEALLIQTFAKYGAVDYVSAYPARSYAFIEFRDLEDAKEAKSGLQGKLIKGQSLRIEFAKPAKPSKHLWIWGVSETVTKEQLEAEFKKFGPLDDFRLLRDRNSALAEFRRIEDASAAVKGLNKKFIQGEELRVDFLRSHSGKRGRGSLVNQPLNANGELVTDPGKQLQIWEGHYSRVFADADGTSKDPLVWCDKHVRLWPGMPEICDPLNWFEVRDACRRLKRHKAAGGDGLSLEFFKLGERNNPSKPRSEMGKAYLHMVEMIYDTGDVPAGASDVVIVSIPKKGDLTNTDNYRGIALISVAIKILTTVVTRRMLQILEKRKFFNPAQAGFCTGEECIGQVACLKEIVKLRHKEGKPTYAAYIDFKKAYDTVPHEALFPKLAAAGLQGRVLRFFQALYRSSSVKVRHIEQLSDSIPVQRGVRQGCPASPCLFNVYINDILDADGETWGLEITNFFRKMKGLLFADDLVLLANSPESLQTSLDKVSEWAKTWSMKFGIDKCMVTVFHGDL
ncbi:hypothetical protein L7F22_017435 [Adiantum nelumboides]|nr:hypothetical protein [Adiantum nelumboides]